MILTIALIGGTVFGLIMVAMSMTPKGKAEAARYCTKHVINTSSVGGPDRLVWLYGPHRTQGNACDGPEHKRSPNWW